MHYTKQSYEMLVAANAHANNPKPTYEEREKLIAEYRQNSMTKVQKITADLVKEVMTDDSNKVD
ncbi:hypothetical protein BTO30_16235 [Domibacillus antri]|uniref:Uncharacterized protein n=1 Tax=Domibacillus antri TaxID=1714264 RepID=A0A1Q8Q1J9_9BACI|nr:hypothetical protein [Domibacillus antri]OLN21197.1 hypothetical protein BTO30_16235 [Domibacillus antri]